MHQSNASKIKNNCQLNKGYWSCGTLYMSGSLFEYEIPRNQLRSEIIDQISSKLNFIAFSGILTAIQ